jgi:hypothetical protein
MKPPVQLIYKIRDGNMAHAVEYLSSKLEALSSNPIPQK